MYSAIANNTFSYLLTLDEFRNGFEDEVMPSWVKITTITMVSSFAQNIDIPRLRDVFEKHKTLHFKTKGSEHGFIWSIKPTTFYNQITLTYQDHASTKSIKVFPNGSIQVAGCSDLFDCNRIINQLKMLFTTCLDIHTTIPNDSFRVVMINSNFSLNYNINLVEVARHFEKHFNVSFEPDRYSAVKVKFKPAQDMKEITTSIFRTGKIIITGAETLKEIAFAYNIINHHINENPKIKVSRTEEVDTFECVFGNNIHVLLDRLKKDGFKSWIYTTQNRKINF